MRKSLFLNIVFSFLLTFLFTSFVFARSGCCSYHNGVRANGCGCNDGTPLSSTCAPYYQCNSGSNQNTVQQVQQVYEAPTSIPYIPPLTKVPRIFPTVIMVPTNTSIPIPTIIKTPTPKPTKIISVSPKAKVNKVSKTNKLNKQPTKKKTFWQWLFNR